MDDLLSGGDTWEAYLQAQKELLQTLRDSNWLVTVNKVRLGYTELHTLGHVVGHGYIKPDMAKVEALQRLTRPHNITALRAFLGLVGFYRKFTENFAKRAKPLTELLKHDSPFEWTTTHQQAFEDLQHALSATTMLATPCEEGRYKMYTDFCSQALAAVLHQVGPDGIERPLHFASRLCRGPEMHLSSAEGELAALVFGLGKFRAYLGS